MLSPQEVMEKYPEDFQPLSEEESRAGLQEKQE